ncbi:hypothetical protein ACFYYH_05880 [Streptomyces sp. NPDC002018]|uniref:hypothetical protein n=1 Tax=Streptomyces sp. NPDC002018 TaxID=3364629 RepID=UPI00368FBB86
MRSAVDKWREDAQTGHTYEPSDVTIELDGAGRELSELPPGARPSRESGPARETGPEISDGPVFVDASGRRGKTFRRAGWVVAIACACYAVTLVGALIGGNSSAPWLQIPGLADKQKPDTVEIQPAPTTSESVGVTPVTPDATSSPTDPDGVAVPRPSESVTPDTSGKPAPGTSASAKPPADPAGGTGGTKPDPGTTPGTGGNPGEDGGGTGGEPPTGTSPDPDPPTTEPGSPPVESPPVDGQPEGSRPLAAEGAR